MKVVSKWRDWLFQITLMFFWLSRSTFAVEVFGSTFLGQTLNLGIILIIILFGKKLFKYQDKWSFMYIAVMLIGFLFHTSIIPFEDNFKEILNWSFLIMLATYFKNCQKQSSGILAICTLIFILFNCGIGIWEQITKMRFFEYNDSEILEGFLLLGEKNVSEFRSFALLGHPLNNANVASIFLGFVLVYNRLRNSVLYWYLLISFVSLSLWGFNSRAAMLVCGILIVYRLGFYEVKIFKLLISFLIVYLILPIFIEFVSNTELLGRFNFDFSDGSSLARLESFYVFFNQRWNFEELVYGGRLLYMPGTELLLENGFLLNIGYWGVLVGISKFILELIISYHFLDGYQTKQKIIIMLSVWGVALANNNTFNPFILVFFFALCISIRNKKVLRLT